MDKIRNFFAKAGRKTVELGKKLWNFLRPICVKIARRVVVLCRRFVKWLKPILKTHKKEILRALSYLLVATVSASATALILVGVYSNRPGNSKLDVLSYLITEGFVGEADKTKMEDAAAGAMVDALGDRWSHYIPADEYAAYNDVRENIYVGIGITFATNANGMGLNVQKVTAGSSAEKAGILGGDTIVAVNGVDITGKTTNEVKAMIRGDAGTKVQITILRDGQTHTVEVTREEIRTPVATGVMLENGMAVVKIHNFNDTCAKQTKKVIDDLIKKGAHALIFDVRYNSGGYARELVDVLDYLLPEGPLLRTEDFSGKEVVEYSDKKFLDIPMAVLVNGGSYSAAEFFAAALSEYGVAAVIGEQTIGKGYYQNIFMLPDGSAVNLSVGKYYTPRGVNLAGVGITPDVVVPVDNETALGIYTGSLDYNQDPQVAAAIKALSNPLE